MCGTSCRRSGYETRIPLEKKKQLAAAFESVMLGNFEDRRRYVAALEAITDPSKREAFISVWQDGRSSLNDVGTYCHSLAKALKEQEEKKK